MKLQLIAATVMLALPAFGQDIMVTDALERNLYRGAPERRPSAGAGR